jgi:serine/threonine-protein kinase
MRSAVPAEAVSFGVGWRYAGGTMGEDALRGIASTLVQLGQNVPDGLAFDATLTADAVAPSTASAGVLAERYSARGLLGEGGMGRVERVWDRDLMREVAVKALRPELRTNAELLQQFLWEARVAAHLDHPNIVPVHDLGVSPDGHLFFTMKLVQGRPLDEVIRKVQVCSAVAFAHQRGVIHRDLKPANLMLGEHGEVLITDWGLALPLAGEAMETLAPPSLQRGPSGTPAYMSPERVKGDASDLRSDVYALGAILYELVALQPAYDAPSVPALLVKVAAGEHPSLSSVCPEAASSVVAVVERAMAFEPEARYASAKELASDVEAVIEGGTPSAETTSILRRAARFYVGRDPALSELRVVDFDLWVAAGMALGLGVGLLLARWLASWWWASLVAALLIGFFPTRRWIEARRRYRERSHVDVDRA